MMDFKTRTAYPSNDRGPVRIGNLVFTPDEPRVEIAGRPVYLCRQELALLQLLATRKGSTVSAVTIAKRMARGRKPLTVTGVAVYIHRLRARLKYGGVKIRTLRGFGYLLEPSEPRMQK
jgi:two-component system OmpR family response regulator